MDNQYVLIAFGVLTFLAIGYLIWSQSKTEDQNESDDVSAMPESESADESDSYYDDSEVYSD